MLRAILRHVQFGLILSATLLVVLAFQRLQLYSVPVLVGHIVHPGAGGSGDSYDTGPSGDAAARSRSRKELVGHGHAHGVHRIFSTNVIEVGLFKFVVPFRWSRTATDDVEEEAVKKQQMEQQRWKGDFDRPTEKRRGQRNRGKTRHSEDERAQRGGVGRRKRPRVDPRSSPDQLAGGPPRLPLSRLRSAERTTEDVSGKEVGNSTVAEPILLPQLNGTVIDGVNGSNITALAGRRLTRDRRRGIRGRWIRWR